MRDRSGRPPAALIILLAPLAFLSAAPAATAAGPPPDEAFLVLASLPEGPRITPYLRNQLDRAWEHDARRRETFERARTGEEVESLKRDLRAKVLEAIGGLPSEKTPLNPRVTGTVPGQGYRIEKLIFESLPGFHVTALVYLPGDPEGPKPAVLLACGHSPLGKAFERYQEIAARLARRGYVVLCWDPVGQGERSQLWETTRGRSRYNLVCGEHAVLGNLATLAGASIARWMIWDGIRAVDYLLTRPDVDPKRLSVTGTSGGGFQSTYLGALDERIGVIAPSCFPTALPMRMANRIFADPDSDPEQDPFGLVSSGVDHAGLLLLSHPRPLHVSAAVLDFFPIEGTRAALREIARFYRQAGDADRLVLKEGYHEHSYSADNQVSAFAFLDRWNGLPVRESLPEVSTLPAETLRCTPSGQVRVDLPGRSLVDVIRDHFAERHERSASSLRERYRHGGDAVASRPIVPWQGGAARDVIAWQRVGSTTHEDLVLDRYRLDHSGGLVLPLVHIHRPDRDERRVVLDIGLAGKARPSDWPQLLPHLEAGSAVVTFDPRGLGETRMRYRAASIDDPEIAPEDEAEAYANPVSGVLANHVYNSLLLGRPYLFEIIDDVAIVGRFARQELGARQLAVSGRGEARVIATAAAAVLDGIEAVPAPGEASGSLSFWAETLESGRETWPIHLLLPGGAALREPPPE
jgi:hypothetical protein